LLEAGKPQIPGGLTSPENVPSDRRYPLFKEVKKSKKKQVEESDEEATG